MSLYALDGVAPERPGDGEYWIAPGAAVIGAVTLAPRVGIWFGAVLRGDQERITIGEDTNVQEHSIFHTDHGFPLTVGKGCTIGHRAVLHGCTIGDRVLIGMGATVLNHAVIAEDCVVGAGALVTEGKSFPPKSLIVGAPARAVKTLTDEQLAGLRMSAAVYVEKAKRYRAALHLAETEA